MQSLRRTPYEDGFPQPEDPPELERRAAEESAALVTISPSWWRSWRRATRCPATCGLRQLRARPRPAARAAGAVGGPLGSSTRARCRPTAATTTCATCSPRSPSRGSRSTSTWRAWCRCREIPAIRVHDPLPATALLRELVHYDFGWAGFNAGLTAPPSTPRCPTSSTSTSAAGCRSSHSSTPRCGGCWPRRASASLSTMSASWLRRWRLPMWSGLRAAGGGAARAVYGRVPDQPHRGALQRGRRPQVGDRVAPVPAPRPRRAPRPAPGRRRARRARASHRGRWEGTRRRRLTQRHVGGRPQAGLPAGTVPTAWPAMPSERAGAGARHQQARPGPAPPSASQVSGSDTSIPPTGPPSGSPTAATSRRASVARRRPRSAGRAPRGPRLGPVRVRDAQPGAARTAGAQRSRRGARGCRVRVEAQDPPGGPLVTATAT